MQRFITIAPKYTNDPPFIRDTWAKSPPSKTNPLEPYIELKSGDWPMFDHRDLLNWLDSEPVNPVYY